MLMKKMYIKITNNKLMKVFSMFLSGGFARVPVNCEEFLDRGKLREEISRGRTDGTTVLIS